MDGRVNRTSKRCHETTPPNPHTRIRADKTTTSQPMQGTSSGKRFSTHLLCMWVSQTNHEPTNQCTTALPNVPPLPLLSSPCSTMTPVVPEPLHHPSKPSRSSGHHPCPSIHITNQPSLWSTLLEGADGQANSANYLTVPRRVSSLLAAWRASCPSVPSDMFGFRKPSRTLNGAGRQCNSARDETKQNETASQTGQSGFKSRPLSRPPARRQCCDSLLAATVVSYATDVAQGRMQKPSNKVSGLPARSGCEMTT
ncbi:uncharacterized protein BKA78DRAFT_309170 [Phyllosticta capitalensis]|uniref:uncharacterized protein n=1 Tax=Phyllosticta capitalensis TaxID=121624 RepID=UPI00312D016F